MTQEPSQNVFDFVNIKARCRSPSSARKRHGGRSCSVSLALTTKLTLVSILFFLWGFAYGLIRTLNMEIQNLRGWTPSHTIALHNADWAAYFFGP
jgi:fucose permease